MEQRKLRRCVFLTLIFLAFVRVVTGEIEWTPSTGPGWEGGHMYDSYIVNPEQNEVFLAGQRVTCVAVRQIQPGLEGWEYDFYRDNDPCLGDPWHEALGLMKDGWPEWRTNGDCAGFVGGNYGSPVYWEGPAITSPIDWPVEWRIETYSDTYAIQIYEDDPADQVKDPPGGGTRNDPSEMADSKLVFVVYPIPYEISFIDTNEGGNEHDICYNDGSDIVDPIWTTELKYEYPIGVTYIHESDPDKREPTCYTMDTSPTMLATFWVIKAPTEATEVTAWPETPAMGGASQNLGRDYAECTTIWPVGHQTWTFTTTAQTALPASVGISDACFEWYARPKDYSGEDDVSWGRSASLESFRVVQTPTHPQMKPWKFVLNKTCNWAGDRTTVEEVMHDVTEDLFDWYYHVTDGYKYEVTGIDAGTPRYFVTSSLVFNLWRCMSDMYDVDHELLDNVELSSYDIAEMVAVFSNAAGPHVVLGFVAKEDPSGTDEWKNIKIDDFASEMYRPIGLEETNKPFGTGDYQNFTCHWAGVTSSALITSAKVYDPGLEVDYNGPSWDEEHVGEVNAMIFDKETTEDRYDDFRGRFVSQADEYAVCPDDDPPNLPENLYEPDPVVNGTGSDDIDDFGDDWITGAWNLNYDTPWIGPGEMLEINQGLLESLDDVDEAKEYESGSNLIKIFWLNDGDGLVYVEARSDPEAAKKFAVATVRNNDWPNYQTDTEKLNIVGISEECDPADRVLFAGRVLKEQGPPEVHRYYRIVFTYKNAVVRLWVDPSLDVGDMIDMELVGNWIQENLWDED